jgi:hypothetical protein
MKTFDLSIIGPYSHENLSIFLLAGADAIDGRRYMPLHEALENGCVTVRETGQVHALEVENLSEFLDLYIQAGDVVKGGRQDRTLGVDFVLPPKSGRVPVPSFCVESGRWHHRSGEDGSMFFRSLCSVSISKLRLAAKLEKSQQGVWAEVAGAQADLCASLEHSVCANESPTSYQLSVEDPGLQERKESFRRSLAGIIDEEPDVLGYAFVINGRIHNADAYGSGLLFRKLWNKLLDAAVVEAIAESRKKAPAHAAPITAGAIGQWFLEAEKAAISSHEEIPPRVSVDTRRGTKTVVFDTRDHGVEDALLHKNLVAS